jgi:hypothetical protein
LSRTSLAVSTDELADAGSQRVVSMRVFNQHVHRLALLALVEAAVVVGSVYAAMLVRFHDIYSGFPAFEAIPELIWPRAMAIAAVFLPLVSANGL